MRVEQEAQDSTVVCLLNSTRAWDAPPAHLFGPICVAANTRHTQIIVLILKLNQVYSNNLEILSPICQFCLQEGLVIN
jgi:hypothetical protein